MSPGIGIATPLLSLSEVKSESSQSEVRVRVRVKSEVKHLTSCCIFDLGLWLMSLVPNPKSLATYRARPTTFGIGENR